MLQPIDGLPPPSLPFGHYRTSFFASLCLKLNDNSNGSTNVTALPLTCPQPGVDPSTYSEDCLSMIIYVPTTLTSTSSAASASTLVWFVLVYSNSYFCHCLKSRLRIHGGSFIVGSATGPGLDGSKLAIATNSIVAVVQYRLGAVS